MNEITEEWYTAPPKTHVSEITGAYRRWHVQFPRWPWVFRAWHLPDGADLSGHSVVHCETDLVLDGTVAGLDRNVSMRVDTVRVIKGLVRATSYTEVVMNEMTEEEGRAYIKSLGQDPDLPPCGCTFGTPPAGARNWLCAVDGHSDPDNSGGCIYCDYEYASLAQAFLSRQQSEVDDDD